jgi:hypothetical protein
MSIANGICCSTHGDGKPDVPCPHSPTGLVKDRRDGSRLDGLRHVGVTGVAFRDSDGREIRHDANDDPLVTAARELKERLATQHCRTDSERKDALERLEREREQDRWMAEFRARCDREDAARTDAEQARADHALETALAEVEERIPQQWDPQWRARHGMNQ